MGILGIIFEGLEFMRYLILLFSAIIMSCGEAPDNLEATSSINPAVKQSDLNAVVASEGASSGGGGFSDTYATETLKLAKLALSQMIENTSDQAFLNLPKDKRKDWIVFTIRNIQIRDVEEYRYNRPLKFNYDLENDVIYATKYFVQTFPYGRFYTRPAVERVRILTEVYIDILHELSHFYGIGLTEASDLNSELWAINFMRRGIDELYSCSVLPDEKLKDGFEYKFKNFYIHAPTGVMQAFHYENPLEYAIADGSFLLPYVTYYESNLESNNFWDIVFTSHVSLGFENDKELLENSIYSALLQESDNEVMWFFDEITRTKAKDLDFTDSRLEVRKDDAGLFVPTYQVENLIREERSRFNQYDSNIYGGLVNSARNVSFFEWSGVYTFDIAYESVEKGYQTSIQNSSSFKLDKENLTARYLKTSTFVNPESLTEDQVEAVKGHLSNENLDFKCKHHIPSIDIQNFIGDKPNLNLID